jgi:hypothetical protein
LGDCGYRQAGKGCRSGTQGAGAVQKAGGITALGCLFQFATLGTAIAAGLGYFSFWWALIPAFIAGSFSLSNGPHYKRVIEANQAGRTGFSPLMLAASILPLAALAGVAFWITSALFSN